MGRTTPWPPEREEQLRVLAASEMSAGEIAAELGYLSRNAVMGKMCRMKLDRSHRWEQMKPKPGARNRRKDRPPPRLAPIKHNIGAKAAGIQHQLVVGKHEAAPVSADDQAIPMSQRRALLDLENHHCRFPVGEVGAKDFFFCGGPADLANNQPYCPHHTARSVNPSRGPYVPERVLAA